MIAWLGYLAADLAVRVLPPRAADALAIALARLAFHARLPARRAQERNLERLLDQPPPPLVRRCARESFEHFALALGDFLRLDSLAPEALERAVEVRGERHLAVARASGRGVVLLTAHLGNWEWGAAWLAARGSDWTAPCRFDVIAISPDPHSGRNELVHLKDAFRLA